MLLLPAGFMLSLAGVNAQPPQGWGTVKGRLIWDANVPVPERKPIAAVAANNDKAHCLSKGPILDETVVVHAKNKGLRWALVVLLDGANPNMPPPIHPDLKEIKNKEVVIDQPCCMFVPHVLAMRQGQTLVAKNSAPIAHNFKWTGNVLKGVGGNVLMPPNAVHRIPGLAAERLPMSIDCNIHSWMHARVGIYNHPYFAVTNENGAFELVKAPAGNFRLWVYHESKGYRGGAKGKNGEPIQIKADAVTDLGNLEY